MNNTRKSVYNELNTVKLMVPTKVETTLSARQLVSALGMALFGDPGEIQMRTGKEADDVDFFIRKTVVGEGDEKTVIKELCYNDDGGKTHVYDDRGELYIRWYKLARGIIPGMPDLVELEVIKNARGQEVHS